MMPLGDDATLPLPQRPVPTTITEHYITTIVSYNLFGRETANTTIEQRQKTNAANQLSKLRAVMYFGEHHTNISFRE